MTHLETVTEEERFRDIAYRRSADPAGYYEEQRARGPVMTDQHPLGHVEVINRAEVEYVLRNPDIFSSNKGVMGSSQPVIPIGIDPPLLSSYRRLLDPAFSPRQMNGLIPKVADKVNALIDEFIDTGECDFSEAISVPLPATTFIDLLGLPQSKLPTLLYWKDVMIHHVDMTDSPEAAQALLADTVPKIYEYIYSVIADRRDKAADDVVTRLLESTLEDGRALTDDEIARTLFLLISAGLDTVSISLQCIFHFLATHPEARQMLVEDPDSTNNLIEELLRWESPVQTVLGRIATRDTEVGGCPIKAGSIVEVSIGGANLDPAVAGADTVDLTRGDKPHIAFGGGPHRCLGSHLARMELRTVVREWHKRIPNYRLKADYTPEWNANVLRGVNHLMLEWDPEETTTA